MADIEEHIQKAIEEGQFKDLPGQGEPLRLDDNPHEDAEWRLAHHMLHAGGFSLPWIELRQEIETESEQARMELKRAWEWRRQALGSGRRYRLVQDEWERVVGRFKERVEKINKRIFDYNLQAPALRLQTFSLNAEAEISQLITTSNEI
ncbi:MAG: DUF1992 domain-containing protein [Anaerolineales bacterium]|nr:DUF1992 domain-containing protein [Anaerolineales bacterium]